MNELSLFTTAIAILLTTPGPTNTLLAAVGAGKGIRRSLPFLGAELGGYLASTGAFLLVLGPVIASGSWIAFSLRLVAATYLAVIAVQMVIGHGKGSGAQACPLSLRHLFLATLVNPKGAVFALNIFPISDAGLAVKFAIFALLVPAVGFGWIAMGATLSRSLPRLRSVTERVAGVCVIGFAFASAAAAFR